MQHSTYEEIDEEKYRSVAIWIATQQLVYNLTSHEITYKQLKTRLSFCFVFHSFSQKAIRSMMTQTTQTFSLHNHVFSSAEEKSICGLKHLSHTMSIRFVDIFLSIVQKIR